MDRISRNCGKDARSSDSRSLQLQFSNAISLPVFTGTRIEGEGGTNMEVALIDVLTGQVVSSGPGSSAKVEIVVLEGDFDGDEGDNWTHKEFANNVVREREGKKPLLTGDVILTLNSGMGSTSDVSFTDNSSWTRSRKFRLGARLLDDIGGLRVREARSDPFVVRDHRGELYKKHHPPSLTDEVWRLEKIGKDGAFHKRLSKEGIRTVHDFLLLLSLDPTRLRNILGSGMSAKKWEVTVEHARTCVLDKKLYLYNTTTSLGNNGVVFNVVGQVVGIFSNGQYVASDKLSDEEKADAHHSVTSAFRYREKIGIIDESSFNVPTSSCISSGEPSSNMVSEGSYQQDLTSQNIVRSTYSQPSPDFMQSLYPFGASNSFDFYLPCVDPMEIRYDEPLAFPGQVANTSICDTDTMAGAFSTNDHLKYFEPDCSLPSADLHANAFIPCSVSSDKAHKAHAAEDVIESHIVDQIDAGTSLGSSLDLQQIIEDMDAVMEKATKLKKKWGSREEQATTHSIALMEIGESNSTAMVGLDEELIQLMDELTGDQSRRHIISIVGMGGMGKTTLAKDVYQNLLIKEHFQFRAWATVSEQYDAGKILSQLLSGLGQSTSGTVDSLGEQLHKTLSGRSYLIILDDVWSVRAWDKVCRFLPDNGNGSRVVLTTRLSTVAKDSGSSSFTMNLLDEGKSWNLFCEKALFPQKDDPPQLENVGREIVKLCKGLALSIVVVGGLLLKAPRIVGYWEDVVRDIKSIPNSKEKQESLDVLSLSYNHLPPHLKPCFLYMGVFKEDSQIHVSNIIKLWVAEGFIKADGGGVLEEIGEGYLKDLIERNLILVGKLRKNGKIGSFGIHDLLRDLCLKVAEQQQFFHVSEGEIGCRERRLVCDSSVSQKGSLLTRSIMIRVIGPRAYDSHLVKYRLLRVWNQVNRQESPEELYRNVNLRYLSYEHPYEYHVQGFWELPSSLSLIWNLQTLIIKDYRNRVVVAPIEIWKMRQLRHVECWQIYLPSNNGQDDELLILENLQTLKTAVNLRLSEEVCKIIPNIKKLYLCYNKSLHGYDHSLIVCLRNLDRLHKLESLKLDLGINMELRFPNWLNKLSLSFHHFHWDDLTIIGSLPHLQILRLKMGPLSLAERWSPIKGQFLRLKFLKIDSWKLLYWDADNSHFPVLEKLILCNMKYLREIPVDIGEIPTLKLISVEHCSESATISAIKIKEEQLESQENDDLQIQVKTENFGLWRFKEALKTEGLTFDNFQLKITYDYYY